MTLPVLAIRPEPGCAATLAAGEAIGLAIRGVPLFQIRPQPWRGPPANAVDGLLLGSANAVRHAGSELTRFLSKPAYVVGEATADAAREAGLEVAAVGEGGLQNVIDTLPGPLRLLRLAGKEHVPIENSSGVHIRICIVYAAVALPLPSALADELRGGAVVLLHSAAAARHFAGECDRHHVPRQQLRLAALGPRIAAAAGEGWRQCWSAAKPTEGALLALTVELCNDRPGTRAAGREGL
jgi:uroporphyrinogen-III synthase